MTNIVRTLVEKALKDGMPKMTCLNVNFPKTEKPAGVKVCRMAHGHWRNEVEKCTHPSRGYDYYFMCGYYQNDEPEAEDTDAWALLHNYVAITPISVDITDFDYLKTLKLTINK
jgi:5'-nucleotidase